MKHLLYNNVSLHVYRKHTGGIYAQKTQILSSKTLKTW